MIKRQLKKVIVITLGVLSIIIGLAGLVLPILQGWLFLAIGGLLLSMYSPRLRAWIHRRTEPFAHIHKFVVWAEGWTERVFGAPEV
jgi:uncharacterized membrane protein YbaN (DUF454 family)